MSHLTSSADEEIKNVYSAQPATPMLASSLLPPPCLTQKTVQHQTLQPSYTQRCSDSQSWNLKTDIKNGIVRSMFCERQCSPVTSSVFRCGIIVGFSWLKRGRRRGGTGHHNVDKRSNNEEDLEEGRRRVGEVPLYLLTAFLQEKSPDPSIKTRAFIIHPAGSSMFSPDALLSSLISEQCHRNPLLSRDDAIDILDAVQLLPVFDFPGVVQAIGAVSSALHGFKQRRNGESELISATNESVILIIVEGLDILAEGVIRTSSPLRGSALLTSALRTLTHLVRTYASFLSVMLVNTSGLGGISYGSNNDQPAFAGKERPSPSITQPGNRDRAGGLYSIFSHPGAMSSLLPTLLSRSLDQGIDTHLLLSLVEGGRVVEVIKDRTGDSMGRWCTWD